MVSAAGAIDPGVAARIAQGMRNAGSQAAPKTGIFSSLVGAAKVAGGLVSPKARVAAQVAGPAIQGAAAGAGFAVGQAATKPLSWIKALLMSVVPEFSSKRGFFGVYVWLIMFVYWMSWAVGFAPSAVLRSHAILALVGFLIFLLVEGLNFQTFRRYGILFSVIMIIDYLLLTGTIHWNLLLIAALLMAFREGSPVEDAKRVFLVMLIASIGFYVYTRFNDMLIAPFVMPFFAKLNLPLNLDDFMFFSVVLFNRTVTYPFFWYAIFGLGNENNAGYTRVARSAAWLVTLLLIFANWQQISPEVNKIRSQFADQATTEQKAVIPNLFKQAATNARGVVASIGNFFTMRTASAYEGLERTFGFGTPKEQPKMGLQLLNNPTMQGEFNKAREIPTASAAVSMLSPLHGENIRALYITGVECSDKTPDSVGSVKGTIIGEDEESLRKGVAVVYDRDRTVYCEFKEQSEMKPGEKHVEIKVTYNFYTAAYADSALMRSDKLDEQLITAADKGGVAKVRADNAIPPAKAEYDNGPVAVKWGPLDMGVTPVAINPDRPKPYWIEVHVSKSSEWEGDIDTVKELHLVVPPGVVLKEDRFCAFAKSVNNYYKLKESFAKDFIGDGKVFKCNIEISNTILGGKDWAAVRFEAYGNFAISLRKQVSFEVKGENPGQQANQQLQQAQAQQEQAGQDVSQGGVDGQ